MEKVYTIEEVCAAQSTEETIDSLQRYNADLLSWHQQQAEEIKELRNELFFHQEQIRNLECEKGDLLEQISLFKLLISKL